MPRLFWCLPGWRQAVERRQHKPLSASIQTLPVSMTHPHRLTWQREGSSQCLDYYKPTWFGAHHSCKHAHRHTKVGDHCPISMFGLIPIARVWVLYLRVVYQDKINLLQATRPLLIQECLSICCTGTGIHHPIQELPLIAFMIRRFFQDSALAEY